MFLITNKTDNISTSRPLFKQFAFLFLFFSASFFYTSCKTIAYYDNNSFVKTAELKAKTLVLIGHANEEYKDYRNQVDDIMIVAETLYAMQKARQLNFLTVKQWDILMKGTGIDKKSILPEFFNMWKRKGKLNDFFIDEAKEQIGDAFDEILKLEEQKIRK
jgi:hypothetical protein